MMVGRKLEDQCPRINIPHVTKLNVINLSSEDVHDVEFLIT